MNIPLYYKRLLSFVFAIIILLSSGTLAFAEEGDTPPAEETTPIEETTPSEDPPAEESTPSEEPPIEEPPAEEPPAEQLIDSFEALKAAIEARESVITITGSIEFIEPINIPEMMFEINGGELINAQFSGLGQVSFPSTVLSGTLTTTSRVTVKITGNAPSVVARESSSIIVSGSVISSGDGVASYDNASITVSGNVDAAGIGVIVGSGTVKIDGSVKSGSDGVQFTNLDSIKGIGAISAGSGIMYRDIGGSGGTLSVYQLGQSITFTSSGEFRVRYDGAEFVFRALDANAVASFSITNDVPSAIKEIVGFETYKSFGISTQNCSASLSYSNAHRVGASALLLQTHGEAFTVLSNDRYAGNFSVENAENSTVTLLLTTARYTVTTIVGENGSLTYTNSETFLEGEVVEFIASPNEKYDVNVFTINDEAVTMSNGRYYHTIISDVTATISFKFALQKFTVTFRQTVGGTVSHAGVVTVTEGDSLTFTMTPDDGFYLSMIEINKELMTDKSETYTIHNITEDLIVFITFKQSKTYSIVLKHTAGGSVTADDAAVFYGGSTKIRITPDEGYMVDKVIADFGTLSTTSDPNIYRLKNITVDTIVTVSFKKTDGNDPPAPVEMLKVSDVSWDYHPIRLELFEYTVISEDVIEKLKTDYPDVAFTIVGDGFNWNFNPGDADAFPEGDLDFGVKVGKSQYEESHLGFSGGASYVSVTVPEGTPTVGELKIFVGRAFIGLPFFGYSYDGTTYTKISEGFCDAYFEITIPLGHTEIFMLCNGDPSNIITIITEGEGTASPSDTQYVADGGSLKIIFTPSDTSYISKVTVGGVEKSVNGHVLQLDNITEDLEVVCVFAPHVSTEISRVSLPEIKNQADIIVYVFAFVGVACFIVYIILRRLGIIKYKFEL